MYEIVMNEDFVSFELAKKLKEKVFTCKYPFAMYNEDGDFCALYTSADILEVDSDGLQMRDYYCFVDFDGYDCIAPTISQVLKWLREEKKIHIEFVAAAYGYHYIVSDTPEKGGTDRHYSHSIYEGPNDGGAWDEYEEAAIAGIEYIIDNLI